MVGLLEYGHSVRDKGKQTEVDRDIIGSKSFRFACWLEHDIALLSGRSLERGSRFCNNTRVWQLEIDATLVRNLGTDV